MCLPFSSPPPSVVNMCMLYMCFTWSLQVLVYFSMFVRFSNCMYFTTLSVTTIGSGNQCLVHINICQ